MHLIRENMEEQLEWYNSSPSLGPISAPTPRSFDSLEVTVLLFFISILRQTMKRNWFLEMARCALFSPFREILRHCPRRGIAVFKEKLR